ncbi:hypothetical protein E3T46_05680 [Cryobacterium sp. Hh11]|uniref:hypothetical protein n=1 Tax=Cryobacterium sp. Hh11 TaxID=2555868 RepID=UPI0010696739|nr:hypothetical protein [Cryobacterium sp. Hh11]TFD52357.1 hypothetical protein E3T46_05680 [Cryobacterium sp. Hh11]
MFLAEKELEDYLEVHLSLLLSRLGLDLLIIGRQVNTVVRRCIDLLAIDAAGVIYIIELKLSAASPGVIAQVLGYRREIKQLNREETIRRVADGPWKVDLTDAFQRHFGHPLPETVNESQVLVIIAASFPGQTARSILELKDEGYSITAFRYVESDAVSLIPCCRDDQDVEASRAETRSPAQRKNSAAPASHWSPPYRVNIDFSIRWSWLSHAHRYPGPIVTFSFVYEQYEQWVRAQGPEGLQLPLRTQGHFGRQLAALTAESGAWTGVYLAPGSTMKTLATLTSLPSTRTDRDADHWIVGYLRNPVEQEPGV